MVDGLIAERRTTEKLWLKSYEIRSRCAHTRQAEPCGGDLPPGRATISMVGRLRGVAAPPGVATAETQDHIGAVLLT